MLQDISDSCKELLRVSVLFADQYQDLLLTIYTKTLLRQDHSNAGNNRQFVFWRKHSIHPFQQFSNKSPKHSDMLLLNRVHLLSSRCQEIMWRCSYSG